MEKFGKRILDFECSIKSEIINAIKARMANGVIKFGDNEIVPASLDERFVADSIWVDAITTYKNDNTCRESIYGIYILAEKQYYPIEIFSISSLAYIYDNHITNI